MEPLERRRVIEATGAGVNGSVGWLVGAVTAVLLGICVSRCHMQSQESRADLPTPWPEAMQVLGLSRTASRASSCHGWGVTPSTVRQNRPGSDRSALPVSKSSIGPPVYFRKFKKKWKGVSVGVYPHTTGPPKKERGGSTSSGPFCSTYYI